MLWTVKGKTVLVAAAVAVLCGCVIFSSAAAKTGSVPEKEIVQTETEASAEEPEPRPVSQIPDVKKTSRVYLPAEQMLASTPISWLQTDASSPYTLEDKSFIPVVKASSEMLENSVEESHSDAVPENLTLLDTFIATAYCITGTTSTGTYTTVNRTLAVNPNIIPYGTHVWIYLDDGTFVGDYWAEDTGSNMMEHPYVIDIYMGEGSYNECILWGAQHVSVYVEEPLNS